MHKKITYLPIVASCFSGKNIYTTNIQDVTSFENGAHIYTLPRTCFVVKAKAVRHIHLAGPLHEYANLNLALENVRNADEVTWEMLDMEIQSYQEPDPDQYYSVRDNKKQGALLQIQQLSDKGLLVYAASDTYFSNESRAAYSASHRFFEPNIDLASVRDTAFIEVPLSYDYIVERKDKERARIAANMVTDAREYIFELVSLQFDGVYPTGTGIHEGVSVMKEYEQKYIELFIGKSYTDTIEQEFVVCPDGRQSIQRHTLFRFSTENGFLESQASAGKAVVLEIKDLDDTRYISHLLIPSTEPAKENMIFYRLPDNAELRVLYGSIPMATKKAPISQFGALVPYFVKVQ